MIKIQQKPQLTKIFSIIFSSDSTDKTHFWFLSVCCLCCVGMAFGLYIGNEKLTELRKT